MSSSVDRTNYVTIGSTNKNGCTGDHVMWHGVILFGKYSTEIAYHLFQHNDNVNFVLTNESVIAHYQTLVLVHNYLVEEHDLLFSIDLSREDNIAAKMSVLSSLNNLLIDSYQ